MSDIINRQDRECPHCSKKAFRKNGKHARVSKTIRGITVWMECSKCGGSVSPGYLQEEDIILLITESEREEMRKHE